MNKSLDDAIQSLEEGSTINCRVLPNSAVASLAQGLTGAALPPAAVASPC